MVGIGVRGDKCFIANFTFEIGGGTGRASNAFEF